MKQPYVGRNYIHDNDAPVTLILTVAQARYWRNVASHQATVARQQMIAKAADKQTVEAMDFLIKQSTSLIDKINTLLGDFEDAKAPIAKN